MQVPVKVRRATLEAVVTRADGTVERLGVISAYRPSLFARARLRLRQALN